MAGENPCGLGGSQDFSHSTVAKLNNYGSATVIIRPDANILYTHAQAFPFLVMNWSFRSPILIFYSGLSHERLFNALSAPTHRPPQLPKYPPAQSPGEANQRRLAQALRSVISHASECSEGDPKKRPEWERNKKIDTSTSEYFTFRLFPGGGRGGGSY